MNLRRSLRWPESILIILGFLLIGLWFKTNTEARAIRSAEKRTLDAVSRDGTFSDETGVWMAEAPWCPSHLDSGEFGRIEIRRLGISALIAEGAGSAQLERGVGHVPTSVFPGRPGNCALTGLRDGSLRGLGDVRENDVIRIDTLQGTYTYVVEASRMVGSRRVDMLGTTEAPSLTLVALPALHAEGPAPDRFVVRARLVEPTALIAP